MGPDPCCPLAGSLACLLGSGLVCTTASCLQPPGQARLPSALPRPLCCCACECHPGGGLHVEFQMQRRCGPVWAPHHLPSTLPPPNYLGSCEAGYWAPSWGSRQRLDPQFYLPRLPELLYKKAVLLFHGCRDSLGAQVFLLYL